MFAEDALKLHGRAKTEQHLHMPRSLDSESGGGQAGMGAGEYCHIHQQSPACDVTQSGH